MRPMRRIRQQLSAQECEDVLRRCTAGVLALCGDDGYPYAVPLSYVYTGGSLVFHCAKTGYKLDCIRRCAKASFCVVDRDEIIPEKYTTAYRSVMVRGVVEEVRSAQEIRSLMLELGEKYNPGHPGDCMAELEGAIDRVCVLRMKAEEITGKQGLELLKEQNP